MNIFIFRPTDKKMIKEEETARLAPGWYNKTVSTEIICEKVKIIKCEIAPVQYLDVLRSKRK